jgi:hypothetical protein
MGSAGQSCWSDKSVRPFSLLLQSASPWDVQAHRLSNPLPERKKMFSNNDQNLSAARLSQHINTDVMVMISQ